MRPLSLTLEGFTCFKQRQTIAFDGVELFAIWGPTGAGKTSLLDAMVFALFGKVPRLDEKRNRDIISLTRDKAVVVFDFSAGTAKYRVVRTARRKGAPEAKLEDGNGNLLAEGVKGVQAEILRCLGLSYDAFIQSVMLPQGEFARFLKSPPAQRRVILRDLLRLDVYERMRMTAEQRRRDLDVQVGALEQVLAEYTDATPEHVQALETTLDAARQDQQAKQEELARLRGHVETLGALRAKTEELERLRAHRAVLTNQEAEMQAKRHRIDASERAGGVMPQIVRAEHALAAADRERDTARKARDAVEKEQARLVQAERDAKQAGKDEQQVKTLRGRIAALAGIRGVVEAKRGAVERLATAKTDVEAAAARVRTVGTELTGLRKRFDGLVRDVSTAKEALAAVVYNKDLDVVAQRAARDAMQLVEARTQGRDASAEADRAEAAAAKAQGEVEKKAQVVERARLKHAKAAEALENAELAYREVHALHAAVALRRELRPGEPCPVCAQPVRTVPKTGVVPKLDAITQKYEQAKKTDAETRGAEQKAVTEYAALGAAASELVKAAAGGKAAARKVSERLAKLEAKLVEVVGKKFDKESETTLEERVLSAGERLADVRATYVKRADQLASLERDCEVMAKAIEGKATEVAQLQEAADLAKRQAAQILEEIGGLDAQVKAVTTHPDPVAESEELEKQVSGLELAVQTAKVQLAEVRATLAATQRVAATAAEKAASVEQDAAGLSQSTATAVKAAGFDSLEAAKTAVIEPGELTHLRTLVETYLVDVEATKRQISVLDQELAGRAVAETEVNQARGEFEKARHASDEAVGAAAALDEQIRRTRDRLEKRAQVEVRQEAFKAELGVYRQMAEDLRTDRFQEFVLEEAFHELARGASERLKELTDRYALRYEDGNILVVDHDNADETRSADTLSGGETFLASLSLALELSEQIQQAAGAVLLESLFIDEGFGTLDVETLDSVATAIECLRSAGRTVGIITHLRDLADRLPCRIEVDWRSEGSQVEVHVS